MDLARFTASLTGTTPPSRLPLALEALWWDAKGEWTKAHECAQAQEDGAGAWVHAYLHRKEGDLPNAGYWYRRADKPVAATPLDDEWRAIAEALLAEMPAR